MRRQKWFLILIIVVIMFISSNLSEFKINNEKVINQMDIDNLYDTSFDNVYLLFDEVQITTNNFVEILSTINGLEYTVLNISIDINPLYEDKLNDIKSISLNSNKSKDIVDNLYNKYIEKASSLNLDILVGEAEINGINIRMIGINTSNFALRKLINKYPNIKYSSNKNGPFIKMKKDTSF